VTIVDRGHSTSFDSAAHAGGGSIITGGVTNEIALHTTSGKTYPVAVLIP
jgi:archaeal type IV pilus assembly protein PilA